MCLSSVFFLLFTHYVVYKLINFQMCFKEKWISLQKLIHTQWMELSNKLLIAHCSIMNSTQIAKWLPCWASFLLIYYYCWTYKSIHTAWFFTWTISLEDLSWIVCRFVRELFAATHTNSRKTPCNERMWMGVFHSLRINAISSFFSQHFYFLAFVRLLKIVQDAIVATE